jgi:hypothetical protein
MKEVGEPRINGFVKMLCCLKDVAQNKNDRRER